MKDIQIQFNSDISKDNTEVRIAFYTNIGFFIEVAQMLEFNLRKLICYELSVKEIEKEGLTKDNVSKICQKYDEYYFQTYDEKWTLGRLKDKLKESTSLPSDATDLIKEINDYRILIVHKIFQNNVISGNLSDSKTLNSYIKERLIPMTNKASEINKMIIRVIELYRNDLRVYKAKVGLIDSE